MASGTLAVILIGVGVIAAGTITWALWPSEEGVTDHASQTRQDKGAGGVTFKATLDANASTDGELVFLVVLDTHTVDLTKYDVLRHVVLREPNGTDVSATTDSTRSTASTSHHVEATLRFPFDETGKARLVAKELGNVPERVLEFDA